MVSPTSQTTEYLGTSSQAASKPFFGFNVLFLLFLVVACCMCELPRFISFEPYVIYTFSLEALLAVLLLIVGGSITVVSIRVFSAKINYLLLGSFALLSLCVLIGVLALPETIEIPYKDHSVFSFTPEMKAAYVISGMMSFFSLWVLFNFGPIGKHRRGHWFFIYEMIILFGMAAIVYSLITEFPLYQRIFAEHSISPELSPVSWLGQKNAFARYLFVALASELLLLYYDRRYWRYFFVAVFYIFIVLTMAKTPIIITTVFLFLYFVFISVLNWKHKRFISIAHITVAGSLFLVFMILFAVPTDALGGLGDIIASIKKNIDLGGGGTIDDRIYIWRQCIKIWGLNPVFSTFGGGEYAYATLIGPAIDAKVFFPTSHNAWIEMLGRSGVVGCVAYAALHLYFGYRFVLAVKEKRKDVWFSLALLVSLFIQSIFESVWFFDLSYDSLTITLLVILPILAPNGDTMIETRQFTPISKRSFHDLSMIALLIAPGLLAALLSQRTPVFVMLSVALLLVLTLILMVVAKREPARYWLFAIALDMAISIVLGVVFPINGVFDVLAISGFAVIASYAISFCIASFQRRNAPTFLPHLENCYERALGLLSLTRQKQTK